MMTNCLLVRADANASMGTGHVMRCIALAQAWQQAGGSVVFATRALPDALAARLTAESIGISAMSAANERDDISQTIAAARERDAACVVLDGYHLGAQHQRALHEAGFHQLFIDDYGHAEEYCADFVLNQNISASAALYTKRAPYTTLLLGTRYALLRREFTECANTHRPVADVAKKILVTMGGADSENVTAAVLSSLLSIAENHWHIKVVVGPANPNRATLTAFADANSNVELISSSAMPELMQWADLAISATGTTCWELMFMQVPFVGIAVVDNQRPIARELNELGIAITFQWPSGFESQILGCAILDAANSPELRTRRVKLGREYVDGRGAQRVAGLLRSPVFLNPATMDECRLVWEWANDSEVRAVSFDSKPIAWEGHEAWYAAQISDADARFYIARDTRGEPVGQVRFAINTHEAVISVSLAPEHRGKGYGTSLISHAVERLFAENREITSIHAYIKCDNRRSVAAFERAGFVGAGTTTIKGLPALHSVLNRKSV